MKNIFLKTFALCLFLFVGMSTSYAQDYLSTEDAVAALVEKNTEAAQYIADNQGNKTMDYYKAVATVRVIGKMIGDFKSGKSTQEVALANSESYKANKVRSVKPLFPDSNGKYGTNWINEDILVLLETK